MKDRQIASQTSKEVFDSQLLEEIRTEFSRIDSDANGRRRVFPQNACGSFALQRAIDAESEARQGFFPNTGDASWESKMNENVV
jgi:hypothetical protein